MSLEPEFSRVVRLGDIGRNGTNRKIHAEKVERDALTRRFDLLFLEQLSANLNLRKSRDGDLLIVDGQILAKAIQVCIVTLDPVRTEIKENIKEKFAFSKEIPTKIDISVVEGDIFDEFISGEIIDIGELVAQCLSILIDPYPRTRDAEFKALSTVVETVESPGPFSMLSEFKSAKS